MRQATTTVCVLAAGWVVFVGLATLFVFSLAGTVWTAQHDAGLASVVWPLVALVLVAGVSLLLAVHAYVSLVVDDAARE